MSIKRFLNKQKLTINYLKRSNDQILKPQNNASDYVTGSTNTSNANSRHKLEANMRKRPFSTSQNSHISINKDEVPISHSYYKNAQNMKNGLPSYYKDKLNTNKIMKISLQKNQKNFASLRK